MPRRLLTYICLSIGFFVTAPSFAQAGGPYELRWSIIDSGGGVSSGGDFTLSAVIGQADAGDAIAGGDYAVTDVFLFGSKCIVGMDDLFNFSSQWLTSGVGSAADLDASQEVNMIDFVILASYWMDLCPALWPL